MKITTQTSLVGLLLALSTLSLTDIGLATPSTAATSELTIDARLTRLTAALQERANQVQEPLMDGDLRVAIGWADGDGRDWANGRGRGWLDGHGGDWVNANSWRNGWADGSSFYNYR